MSVGSTVSITPSDRLREPNPHAHRNIVCYCIYTEDKPGLPALVSGFFPGFTFIRGVGYWCGDCEQSALIEILGTPFEHNDVRILAALIKTTFNQQTVYVSRSTISMEEV